MRALSGHNIFSESAGTLEGRSKDTKHEQIAKTFSWRTLNSALVYKDFMLWKPCFACSCFTCFCFKYSNHIHLPCTLLLCMIGHSICTGHNGNTGITSEEFLREQSCFACHRFAWFCSACFAHARDFHTPAFHANALHDSTRHDYGPAWLYDRRSCPHVLASWIPSDCALALCGTASCGLACSCFAFSCLASTCITCFYITYS